MTSDGPIEGWTAIAKAMGVSRRSACRMKAELFDANVIWFALRDFPPRRVVRAYVDVLAAHLSKKDKKK